MKKIVSLIILMMAALFIFACADMANEGKIKCPQCGAIFTHMDEDPEDAAPAQ